MIEQLRTQLPKVRRLPYSATTLDWENYNHEISVRNAWIAHRLVEVHYNDSLAKIEKDQAVEWLRHQLR